MILRMWLLIVGTAVLTVFMVRDIAKDGRGR